MQQKEVAAAKCYHISPPIHFVRKESTTAIGPGSVIPGHFTHPQTQSYRNRFQQLCIRLHAVQELCVPLPALHPEFPGRTRTLRQIKVLAIACLRDLNIHVSKIFQPSLYYSFGSAGDFCEGFVRTTASFVGQFKVSSETGQPNWASQIGTFLVRGLGFLQPADHWPVRNFVHNQPRPPQTISDRSPSSTFVILFNSTLSLYKYLVILFAF